MFEISRVECIYENMKGLGNCMPVMIQITLKYLFCIKMALIKMLIGLQRFFLIKLTLDISKSKVTLNCGNLKVNFLVQKIYFEISVVCVLEGFLDMRQESSTTNGIK